MKTGDVFYKKCIVTALSPRTGECCEWEEENFDIERHDTEIVSNIHKYLQNREEMLFGVMNELKEGTELYKETRAKHIELLHILEELKIDSER